MFYLISPTIIDLAFLPMGDKCSATFSTIGSTLVTENPSSHLI